MKILFSLTLLFLFQEINATQQVYNKQGIPKISNISKNINYIGTSSSILSNKDSVAINNTINLFNKKTGIVLKVIIVPTLNNFSAEQMAEKISQSLINTNKNKLRPIVILLNPKSYKSKQSAYISSGEIYFGLDSKTVCERIAKIELLPAIDTNNYYNGVLNSIIIFQSIATNQISATEYLKKTKAFSFTILMRFVLFAIIILIITLYRDQIKNQFSSQKTALWRTLWLGSFMITTNKSNWKHFSSGSGKFTHKNKENSNIGGGGSTGEW